MPIFYSIKEHFHYILPVVQISLVSLSLYIKFKCDTALIIIVMLSLVTLAFFGVSTRYKHLFQGGDLYLYCLWEVFICTKILYFY